MQDKNSKKMKMSYGVDSESESAKYNKRKSKKKKQDKTSSSKSEAKEVEAPAKKPSLISEINEMKAKNETRNPEFAKKMSELENILGVNEINPFGTNELDVFEDKLKGMSESDLQDLAYKVGLNPYIPGPQLKSVLKNEFKSYNRNSMRNSLPSKTDAIKLDPNNPDHAETIKIIGEI